MYSAIVPGLGQAYNHKYWKIPIIYVGGGTLLYFFNYENTHFKDYKRKYEAEYYNPNQNTDSLNNYGLGRDFYRNWRDRFFLYTTLLYAANVIDAMVDAYFFNFDISDNLTMKIEPDINYPVLAMGNLSYGFKLSFKF
jgi:hypothetical protein